MKEATSRPASGLSLPLAVKGGGKIFRLLAHPDGDLNYKNQHVT
jgi:hypothetical protein